MKHLSQYNSINPMITSCNIKVNNEDISRNFNYNEITCIKCLKNDIDLISNGLLHDHIKYAYMGKNKTLEELRNILLERIKVLEFSNDFKDMIDE